MNEVMVPFVIAERYRIEAGETIEAGVGFTEEFTPVETVQLRVVGIYAAPGSFETIGQGLFSIVSVTPALFEKYREVIPDVNSEAAPDLWALSLHLKGGSAAAHAFKRTIERDLNIDVPIIEPVIRSGVQNTMRLYTVALWLLGSLIAAATVAIVGQTLARQQLLESIEFPTLTALGTTRRQLLGLGMMRAGLIGLAASGVASLVAYLLSPLTPIGPARFAEPNPGLAFDATAAGIGAAAVLVLVPMITLIPSLRAARWTERTDRAGAPGLGRASRIVRTMARTSRSPATATGLRMALEPGRGRTAVPVRSTILTVALGVAALSASVVVGRSLTHLIDTPALIGFTYDAIIPEPPADEPDLSDEEMAARLRSLSFTDRVARGTLFNAVFDGVDSFVLAFDDDAPIGYALIEGRPPIDAVGAAYPEIALGPATLRRLHLAIGDTVEFGHPDPSQSEEEEAEVPFVRRVLTKRARIVGAAAIPPFPFAITEPGEGAVMSAKAVERLNLGEAGGCCFIAFKPGTDLAVASDQIRAKGFDPFIRTKRADLATLERVSRLPVLLSAIFAAIAAGALAHVLVTAVRRRRRDLAILKTLGFVRRQVRGAIAWQVSAIALLSVIIGIPTGIALGRWGWRLIAAQFGVVPVSVAPAALLALVLPA
ncbi:MAG: FtsX-like permease family protein, partial [Actinomycetota bacterium]